MSSKRQHRPLVKNFLPRNLGNALYYLILIVLFMIALWALRGHLNLAAVSSSDNATNPIGVQINGNPTDTDIVSLQAAEGGQLNQPALVWFHADW